MINAQEWLDKNYPLEKRKEIIYLHIDNNDLKGNLKLTGFVNIKKLGCHNNQITNLDLTDCYELTEILCYANLLTDTEFLNTLSNPQKVIRLDLGDNNFQKQDLMFLQNFTNLESLQLWSEEELRIKRGIYNRFYGSLKFLKNMSKLENLCISNTDLDSDLEYLPANLKNIYLTSKNKIPGFCWQVIATHLYQYKESNNGLWNCLRYNYQAWRKDYLNKISQEENEYKIEQPPKQ